MAMIVGKNIIDLSKRKIRDATPKEKREIIKELERIIKNPKEYDWNKYQALNYLAKIEMKKLKRSGL